MRLICEHCAGFCHSIGAHGTCHKNAKKSTPRGRGGGAWTWAQLAFPSAHFSNRLLASSCVFTTVSNFDATALKSAWTLSRSLSWDSALAVFLTTPAWCTTRAR